MNLKKINENQRKEKWSYKHYCKNILTVYKKSQ